MKFGKPILTAEPEPAAPEPVPVTLIVVGVTGRQTWTWKFYGDNREAESRALFDKMTGEPDAQGWIRSVADDWAYRADEIRNVTFERTTESPVAA